MGNRMGVIDAIKNTWMILASIIGVLGALWAVSSYYKLGFNEIATILTLLGVGILIWFVILIAKEMDRVCRYPSEALKNGGREEEEEKKKVKPSGAGAFGGMIAGGALGLPFGPAGVLVGGVIGALIGNQIEYESKKRD